MGALGITRDGRHLSKVTQLINGAMYEVKDSIYLILYLAIVRQIASVIPYIIL